MIPLYPAVLLLSLSGTAPTPARTAAQPATPFNATKVLQVVTTVGRNGSRSTHSRTMTTRAGQSILAAPAGARPNPALAHPASHFHPNGNAPSGPVIASQSFGSATVGGQAVTLTVTFTAMGGSSYQFVNGLEFTVGAGSCVTNGTTCSVQVTFTPQFPGLRADALIARDESSNIIGKTFVYGNGVAPLFGYDIGNATGHTGSTTEPTGVAIGPDNRLYIADAALNDVYVFNRDSSNQTALGLIGLDTPAGIAVDGSNTLYISDHGNNRIVAHTAAGVQSTVPTDTLSGPSGIAVDGTGAIYVTDTGNGRILKIDNQGNETTLASSLTGPTGIAVDSAGNVFYADQGSAGEVVELPADGGSPISKGTSLGTTQGLAVDPGGRLYVTTATGYFLLEPGGSQTGYGAMEADGYGPYGIAIDRTGNLFFTESADATYVITDRSSSNQILNAPVGQSVQGDLAILNVGNSALTLSSLTVDGSVFTIDQNNPLYRRCTSSSVLAVGASCISAIDFAPPAPQTYQQTFTAASNSLNVAGTTDPYTLYGNGGPTTTDLAASSSAINSGDSITFTATVSSDSEAAPAGTVTFQIGSDDRTTLGTASIVSGEAQFTTTTLPVGNDTITAIYNGDASDGVSTSNQVVVTVTAATAAPTTTTLAASPASLAVGQTETLTATVSSAGSAPAGTVTFADQSGTLGATALTPGTGTASTALLSLTTLSAGTHQITATFTTDGPFTTSASSAQTVTVITPTTTVTTLAATPATVQYSGIFILNASVTAAGSPVSTGQIILCNASAPHCTPELSLATAQLNSAGTAALHLRSGTIGTHAYTATFLGTTALARSVSTSTTVTVAGTLPSGGILTASGSPGNYTLTGTIGGFGSATLAPAGTISFNDTSSPGHPLLGTATLPAATATFTMTQPSGSPQAVATGPYGVATGDFNADGFLDVVIENYSSESVSILLGNGDGTFQPQVTYAVGSLPERVLVADFNGDGKLDLVVANTGSGTVSILLGNGDGTFQPQVAYAAGGSPVGLGVMDINHDGIADIVASDYYGSFVSVLLGVGDGTFQPQVTYPTGSTPQTLAEGDFNGDGNVDLAVGNLGGNTVGILLGNGDGTFQSQVTSAVGSAPQGIQVGDFNGDGHDDLAVTNAGDSTVSILLGNGDGTFQPQTTYAVGGSPVGLIIADFNGDGKQDISVNNKADATQSILLGNGDGTFRAQTTFPTGSNPYGVAAGDFNGDGFPDLALANFNDGTATILLSDVNQVASASITGISLGSPGGTHNVDVSFPGDANFSPSTSPTIPLQTQNVALAASAIQLSIAPAAPTATQSIVFTVAVAGATQTTPVPTGTVTLTANNTPLATIALGSTGTGTFTAASLPPATYTVTAAYSGDTAYSSSASASQTLTVSLAPQTITFPPIPNQPTGAPAFALSATASSGLPVAYILISGPATLSANMVSVTGPGPVTIRATQAGNTTFAAATPVTQTFIVSIAAPPTLTAISPATAVTGTPGAVVFLTGTGFTASDIVQANGVAVPSTTESPTKILARLPAAFFATPGTGQISVFDPASSTTTPALPLTILQAPSIVFTGPSSATSAQQPALTFQLTNPYTVPLTGTVTLAFSPSSSGTDDPAVQFATGGRSIPIAIPALSIATPAIQLQTGTVAGTATITLTVFANGINVTPASVNPIDIVIPATAPVLSTTTLARSARTLSVAIHGFSNTRELTTAIFHFTPAEGSTVETPDITADVTALFAQWYASTPSTQYGSTFTYTQLFNLNNDAATIGTVTVTLVNSIGKSTPGTAQ